MLKYYCMIIFRDTMKLLNPSGLNFSSIGASPLGWKIIVPWDLQFHCIPQNDRAIIYLVISLVTMSLSRNFCQKWVSKFPQFPHFVPAMPCHSDFTWNQSLVILEVQKVTSLHILILDFEFYNFLLGRTKKKKTWNQFTKRFHEIFFSSAFVLQN